jgi:membrane protein DedA with SNARE-associated domain
MPDPEGLLSSTGLWAYVIIAVILLAETVPVLGALIPAQLFLLGAGFLASLHELNIYLLLIVASASLFVADVASFALGRRYGMALFAKLPAPFALRIQRVSDGLGEHAGKTLVLGKFLGPARALTPPMAGASRLKWPRFLAYELVGSVVWVVVITGLGWLFGRSYHLIEKNLGRGAFVIVLVALVAYLTFMRFRAAKTEERLAREQPPSPPPSPPEQP